MIKFAWHYFEDEQFYLLQSATREDAIKDAKAEFKASFEGDREIPDSIYVGEISEMVKNPYVIDAPTFLDVAYQEMWNNTESQEDWLQDVTDEQKQDLTIRIQEMWNDWLKAHGHNRKFYELINIERYPIA